MHGDTNATFPSATSTTQSLAPHRGDPRVPRPRHRRRRTRRARSTRSAGPSRPTPRPNGFGVVRAFVGHGIGDTFHMAPAGPALLRPGHDHPDAAGLGVHHRADDHDRAHWRHRLWDDDWTAVTVRLLAHRAVRAHHPRDRGRRRGPHRHRRQGGDPCLSSACRRCIPAGRAVRLPGRGTTWVREAAGAGDPPLILLHGLTATAALNWGHVVRNPRRGSFRTIAIDHRGHGRGIRPPALARVPARGLRRRRRRPRRRARRSTGSSPSGTRWAGRSPSWPGAAIPTGWPGSCCARRRRQLRRDDASRPCASPWRGGVTGVATAMRSMPPPVRAPAGQRRAWRGAAGRSACPSGCSTRSAATTPPRCWRRFAPCSGSTRRPWIGEVDVPTAVVVTTEDRVVPPDAPAALAAAIPGVVGLAGRRRPRRVRHGRPAVRPRPARRVHVGGQGRRRRLRTRRLTRRSRARADPGRSRQHDGSF